MALLFFCCFYLFDLSVSFILFKSLSVPHTLDLQVKTFLYCASNTELGDLDSSLISDIYYL